ncbi:hypothetical protein HZP84_16195 [Elizabethkingia anophelis]|nr:hypothetical protein [Elizabethkingia anophelis]MCT3824946.1 hypothetical protein [Elizabethkingia anophelis]MCT3932251.1 hypothetical protein [Elizabethkingia anophelis]MCT4078317.1 hypothetical protein [Elizabethkingia anophelis]MCT4081668.1 hypothetical protein [Elizabethkingia anophelis]
MKEVSLIEVNEIIEKRSPRGKFYCHTMKDPIHYIKDSGAHDFLEDEDLFIAVDNSTGDAWTEEFDIYEDMKSWFNDN